jgi:hypothetical protein
MSKTYSSFPSLLLIFPFSLLNFKRFLWKLKFSKKNQHDREKTSCFNKLAVNKNYIIGFQTWTAKL